jgi:aspartate/tyrosine/aromatic aminotransferase
VFFDEIIEAPIDPIFGLKKDFSLDTRKNKEFLSIGVFQNDDLKTKMHLSVERAIKQIGSNETHASYLPLNGDPVYLKELSKLLFGEEFYNNHSDKIYAAQSVGGTSALRTGAENIFQHLSQKVFLTNPTWINHSFIFKKVGFEVFLLPYYSDKDKKLNFENFLSGIEALSENSVLVLHAVCHNPTGSDFSIDEWKKLSDVIKKRKLFPFFDLAYHGFDKGIEEDAFAVRFFAEQGHEMFIAYSCSKNFSLYRQRVGALFFVSNKAEKAKKVGSHIERVIRVNYSNPPAFGASVVSAVLLNPELRKQWVEDLSGVRKRLKNMRHELSQKLTAATSLDFSFIENQAGMFSLLGLSLRQVDLLREKHAIYMPSSGRVNIAGLSKKNLDYIVDAIAKVL